MAEPARDPAGRFTKSAPPAPHTTTGRAARATESNNNA